ncbi:protein yellow [Anabrus simplex]|uniref:protein yellow n=1 Tax=Anabrus simplex TaxID=316456 RepID=UPI0035A31610
MKLTTACQVLLSLVATVWARNTRLTEIFAWNEVDYAYSSPEARQEAKLKELFIPANNLPLGLDVAGDRLFVTVPRWKSGVPSTLNFIKLDNETLKNKSPPLIPYPNWESNSIPKDGVYNLSSVIISTFRVRADACKRLWVMDTGMSDLLCGIKKYSKPKIMVYDLTTDTLIRTYFLKDDDVTPDSFFANIVVDVSKENCENAYAYLPDFGSSSLVVYSWKQGDSWRVTHHFFHFDPLEGSYRISGIDFQWTDGIFGVSLSPVQADGYRTLYFHPLSSTREFSVSTKIVQDKNIASNSFSKYMLVGCRGIKGQSGASFIHEKTGVMFYTQPNKNAVGCWNIKKDFEENQDIVAEDEETLVFVNDLKVCNNDNLWVLSDKLPTFLYRKINPEEVNYRILMAPVTAAINGTKCDVV